MMFLVGGCFMAQVLLGCDVAISTRPWWLTNLSTSLILCLLCMASVSACMLAVFSSVVQS